MKKRRFQVTSLPAVLVLAAGLFVAAAAGMSWGQEQKPDSAAIAADVADLKEPESEMRPLIQRYSVDRGALSRSYPVALSAERRARLRQFYQQWLDRIAALDFEAMSAGGRVDVLLFKNHLQHELRQLDLQEERFAEAGALIPFAGSLVELEEARRRMEPLDSARAAELLSGMKKQIEQLQKAAGEDPKKIKKTVAHRAATLINGLKGTLKTWFDFYNGYDPVFTWWVGEPYKQVDQALQGYASFLREKIVGVKADDKEAIIGDPIGRRALLVELAHEMIPYTPEELITLAEKEMAWCEAELVKAARELGYGDDWRRALEYVKARYVEPGKQPALIRELALEAIEFLEKRNLVTIPQLARETWRMEMMTPERQLVTPFFTGGEVIRVSYPTHTMGHEQKLMSMRGNNIHFARATVFHELIPGHHLQGFMTTRYKSYRSLFSTPFWGEGWALYWELLFWDLDFPGTPENRIGMLFWRMHRCARIIFSLSFHLEQMTPQECIDFLVKRVGHELENATAEVRRSFNGSYAPLYQAAYLLGGLQFYALRRELVDSGKMSNRAFHDAILKENRIPVEMIRALLTQRELSKDFKSSWRFYPDSQRIAGPASGP